MSSPIDQRVAWIMHAVKASVLGMQTPEEAEKVVRGYLLDVGREAAEGMRERCAVVASGHSHERYYGDGDCYCEHAIATAIRALPVGE